MTMRWVCPHCDGPCRVRTSKQMHDDYRVSYLQCQNPICGWCGKGESIITETTSPSGIPNAKYKGQLADNVPYALIPKPPEDLFRSRK
ncbi:ogr/Delta-like zinc finger family protein [Larsenimonas rhizosphaerae]|uniref:ogr/Delta-like zinc finger family protein n=1 Tax=Larsenimonas rhizosphaerae TaxID=2944682 RepID=UPI002033DE09|nr:ogr/Delta-like zinc finger family protein [Larsenimonas rhizosphaerae]MCM2131438.1 ogr/Delta-like zinc finger family protein [Larsenimonas rhizosphaerae]